MASDPAFSEDVSFRLTPMGPVTARRMFGGHGIFLDGLMFGLVAGNAFYLKTDDGNRAAYEDAGARPFSYVRRARPVELSYWCVPDDVFADPARLLDWADAAYAAARRARDRRPRRKG